MVDFGITLKTLRTQNNYTQVQLAQKLGLTKSVISAYETGLRLPSYDVLINIAKIFKVSTDYLLGMDVYDLLNCLILDYTNCPKTAQFCVHN
ncbi:helix-turn-helix domain-containing protein, partial [Mediterraneibacter gnavus]